MEEVVEICPRCEHENIYINPIGYTAYCEECGRKIFLCDKCLNADHANYCDWHGGKCHRGLIEEWL